MTLGKKEREKRIKNFKTNKKRLFFLSFEIEIGLFAVFSMRFVSLFFFFFGEFRRIDSEIGLLIACGEDQFSVEVITLIEESDIGSFMRMF